MSGGSISMDKLVFDPASAADGSNVGAYLQDAAGNLITSQASGGQRALDVGINVGGVQVDPRDIRALTASDVVSAVQSGTWNINNISGTISLPTGAATEAKQDVGNTSLSSIDTKLTTTNSTLSSIDGKIPALGQALMAASLPVVIASDQSNIGVNLSDGAGTALTSTLVSGKQALDVNLASPLAINIDGTVADDSPDADDPVKVGSRARIGALAAISADNDRADMISDKFRRVYVNSGSNVAALQQKITVGTSAAVLVASSLSGRRTIMVQNLGSKAIFIGSSAAVTTANGFQISSGAVFSLDLGEDVALYAISGTAGQDVRILEVA